MDGILIKDVMTLMESLAPLNLAEDYDNVGLLVGDPEREVFSILVGLELTDKLLNQAIREKVSMVVVHHPLIFRPMKTIVASDPVSRRVIKLIEHGIGCYAAHTNLDAADGGLNDYVMKLMKIEQMPRPEEGIVRYGKVDDIQLVDFVAKIKEDLGLDTVRYVGDPSRIIRKVGLCTGSGMSLFRETLSENIDVYITGDIKYHEAMMALDEHICLIDATHFGSESLVKHLLYDYLKASINKGIQVILGENEKSPFNTL